MSQSSENPGSPMTAQAILDREFLEMRSLILRLAASLDRIQRSEQPNPDQAKMEKLTAGLQILLSEDPDRAKKVQELFSLPYQEDWHQQFGLKIDR